MIDSFSYSTSMLAHAVRERGLLPLEEAVYYLTGEVAEVYGLNQRGHLSEGAWADIAVFDPLTIGPAEFYTRFDLPGGAGRVYGGATGINHVLVAGQEVVAGEDITDARPGQILRSGRDTATVTASGGRSG
jgi:N-acyl-D-aspartate/D-glutamate deacylase